MCRMPGVFLTEIPGSQLVLFILKNSAIVFNFYHTKFRSLSNFLIIINNL